MHLYNTNDSQMYDRNAMKNYTHTWNALMYEDIKCKRKKEVNVTNKQRDFSEPFATFVLCQNAFLKQIISTECLGMTC